MKLVELLAAKLEEWPETVHAYAQDQCGSAYPWTGDPEFDDGDWLGHDEAGIADVGKVLHEALASDYATAIVTQEQWQAERDKQKGGEWKRHRGGKCPVPAGTKVSTRHRDGEVADVHFQTAEYGTHKAVMDCVWKHDGSKHDIMAYKVISQPQAEEVEKEVFVGKDVKLEYAFSEEGVSMEDIDWKPIGGKLTSVEGVDPALFGVVEDVQLRDTLSTYKEFTVTGQWHQIDGPIKWRDTINELDAYIEEFTRERESLINRLAEEGFALLPAMTAVMGVADVDMSEWRSGDVISCTCDYNGQFTKGAEYIIECMSKSTDRVSVVSDDQGERNGWGAEHFKFIRRP